MVKRDTWSYIRTRCEAAVEASSQALALVEPAIRLLGEVHTEVEMEWLRMFYVQGERHSASHKAYWLPRMKDKLLPLWREFESLGAQVANALLAADADRCVVVRGAGVNNTVKCQGGTPQQ